MRTDPGEQRRLVEALGLPTIETHISYVLLGGDCAYKIKKAVDLGFLDFTTLDARRFYCDEELRLNRRLAPSIYLGVIPVTGRPGAPVLGGQGTPIEYAIKMRQFDQQGLLSRVLARGELTVERTHEIARVVAAFHASAARAAADTPFGRPDIMLQPARQNFAQIQAALDPAAGAADCSRIDTLRAWTETETARLAPIFERRRHDGFVRECHGDLHLGNIALVDGRVTLFDCIEFDPAMRWIDVMSDVGFLVMDLRDHGRSDLASRVLNTYLETSGDYAGLAVLRFYVVYRAMVRAKVACLRLAQAPEDQALADEYRTYLSLAEAETSGEHRGIVITHGVTGSGKTTRAQQIVESVGAIRIRSDVERKRLSGLDTSARTNSPVGGGIYSCESSRQTYERLASLAGDVVSAGYPVVVDAAFLERWQRELLRRTAADLHVPFAIADCAAPEPVLRERVSRRLNDGRDASEATVAVLERQLATMEPLAADER
jgi:aminoglycoside phosphotransferase family enzyme/predicted kinase